jgi:hypothetical protein
MCHDRMTHVSFFPVSFSCGRLTTTEHLEAAEAAAVAAAARKYEQSLHTGKLTD